MTPLLCESTLRSRLVELLSALIATPTPHPPGDTTALCCDWRTALERWGYRVQTASEHPGRDNLIASIGTGAPHLVFNVHADTVDVTDRHAWRTDPFEAVERNGRMYGLGAANAKGALAVHLWLAEQIASLHGSKHVPRNGTITFTIVTDDEDVGPHGTSYLRRAGLIDPDYLVIGGPTANALITEERGVMWVELEVWGRAAHAGAPQLGDNAVLRMMRLLSVLDSRLGPAIAARVDGVVRSTLNIGWIQGGTSANVVPDRCVAVLDRRLVQGETVDGAFEEIRHCLSTTGEAADLWQMHLMRGTPAFRSFRDAALVRAMGSAITEVTGSAPRFIDALGAGDGRYFADAGIEIVTTGPGDGGDSHAPNESIAIVEMIESAKIHWAFIERLLGPSATRDGCPAGAPEHVVLDSM